MADIEIVGGQYGMNIGNQQFTMRNINISKAIIGISQIWNWGWLYSGLSISDCETAFSMINGYLANKLEVGSVVIIDSEITNCGRFVDMAWKRDSVPIGAGQLIIENVKLTNVPIAIMGSGATVLQGGTLTIQAWGQGNKYSQNGPEKFQGPITTAARPQSLIENGKYYSKSKPQYENLGTGDFISARNAGATGDGQTDDTKAVQDAITQSVAQNKVLFFEHGVYKVTQTVYIPPGARMVGETFSIIMGSGSFWSDMNHPKPVVQVGRPGESGRIEWSDMIVQTQGATPGAIVIQYNLNTQRGSGLWDVHTRIGGAKGTFQQVAQCPTYTTKPECMAAHTNVHVTKSANGAYFENNWFWVGCQGHGSSVFFSLIVPRLLTTTWTTGPARVCRYTPAAVSTSSHPMSSCGQTASSTTHCINIRQAPATSYALVLRLTVAAVQFNGASNVFAGFLQTETPYYMPNPDAKSQPYGRSDAFSDPDYASACPAGICDAYGLRVLNSKNVRIYGGGLYSFFKNYDVTCSSPDAPSGQRDCQNQIFSIEGDSSVQAFALSQVGALQMLTIDREDKATWSDNLSVYSNTIGYITYRM